MQGKIVSYAEYDEGFRIVVREDGVLIEATDYHARPLHLGRQDLDALGLAVREGDPAPWEPEGRRWPATRPGSGPPDA